MLGVDVGSRRVGLAVADAETRFARPLEVVDLADQDPIDRIGTLCEELGVSLIVVGKPVGLSGADGPAVEEQAAFVARLRATVPVEVREYDERLTTVLADQGMRAAGTRRSAQKRLRDAIAAQVMLQGYLDGNQ